MRFINVIIRVKDEKKYFGSMWMSLLWPKRDWITLKKRPNFTSLFSFHLFESISF